MTVVAFPQHDARMIPASARLHAAIVEQRLTLPDHRELARHAADAVARDSRRGWRIDKPNPRANVDAIIALAIAVERTEHRPAPVELLGWLRNPASTAEGSPAAHAAASAPARARTRPPTGGAQHAADRQGRRLPPLRVHPHTGSAPITSPRGLRAAQTRPGTS